jgi:hypothetical protein
MADDNEPGYAPMADEIATIERGEVSKGVLAEHSFYIQAPVGAFTRLLHGLQELVKRIVVRVDADGLNVCETRAHNNMFIFVNIPADRLEKFTTTGKSLIRFEPARMYTCVNRAEQEDVMYWKFDKKKPHELLVGVMRRGETYFVSEYSIPLLRCTENTYSAPPAEVDYYIGIDSAVFITYINVLVSLKKDFPDDYVTIACDHNTISFSRTGGLMVPETRFTLGEGKKHSKPSKRRRRHKQSSVSDEPANPDYRVRVVQRPVKHRYRLEYLSHLVKCFAMDKLVTIYIRSDFPLIFHVDVGDIGTFRAVLMFAEEDQLDKGNAPPAVFGPDTTVPETPPSAAM